MCFAELQGERDSSGNVVDIDLQGQTDQSESATQSSDSDSDFQFNDQSGKPSQPLLPTAVVQHLMHIRTGEAFQKHQKANCTWYKNRPGYLHQNGARLLPNQSLVSHVCCLHCRVSCQANSKIISYSQV